MEKAKKVELQLEPRGCLDILPNCFASWLFDSISASRPCAGPLSYQRLPADICEVTTIRNTPAAAGAAATLAVTTTTLLVKCFFRVITTWC